MYLLPLNESVNNIIVVVVLWVKGQPVAVGVAQLARTVAECGRWKKGFVRLSV